jgi:dTDP-glucose pyrophosphorylase
MSGSGSRFSDAGYVLPKPLIPVSGKPMIINVINALPPADTWIFIVRKEHMDRYRIDTIIKNRLPNAIIIEEEKPIGQATSCMLALPHVKPEEEIFISACDNSFLYDSQKFLELTQRSDVDSILWTFTKNSLLSARPEAWGWARLEDDGFVIKDMSVKTPVSQDPFHDHAVVATFYFKKAKQFKEACELMIRENYRINNEFYVDALPVFYKKLGWKSVIFDVDLYVGWGKPADLYVYEEKELQYTHLDLRLSVDGEDKLWVRYFDTQKLKNDA